MLIISNQLGHEDGTSAKPDYTGPHILGQFEPQT
jgi:hypothetical protein